MAQVPDADVVGRIVHGEVVACEGLQALIDRDSAHVRPDEGLLLDYKRNLNSDTKAVAEIARDVAAFSNTEGGLILIGVGDGKEIVGHSRVDTVELRNAIGTYIGTRVEYDVLHCDITARGKFTTLTAIVVRRSVAPFPVLLRKDIEQSVSVFKKVKYLRGSLFYRSGSETRVESPEGDIDSRAVTLRFSGVAPRTRTSFVLKEDRPLLRLYANINDRLFGRDKELQELLSKFSDPRGRGVSLAGIGGVGKTELAITLVQQLYDRRQFRRIYSGSAKQTLLGPTGPQSADPVFTDFNSFLRDLAAWLGIDSGGAETARLKEACRSELAKLERVLFFVDNLETIRDRELFDFLESEVPSTVWLVLTGRVHRVRSYVYQKELRELEAHDAAQLLRHELKRQGLVSLADLPIVDIERVAKELYGHPLALRWFAWACKRDPQLWSRGVQRIDREQLEEFCVAHTLNALSREAQKTLGAVLALQGVTDVTTESVAVTAGLPTAAVEQALYDLECSGLVSVYSTDPPGDFVYQLSPLANAPAAGLARKEGWEREYVQNLRTMTRAIAREQPLDPLVSELMVYPLSRIKPLIPAERADLQARVRRSLARCPEDRKYALYALEAECERHAGNPVTADDLYKKSAEQILAQGTVDGDDTKKIRILLEAATVAKARAQSPAQMTRAISYLKAIEHSNIAPQRVLGMLMEFSAILRRKEDYRAYRARAMEYVQAHADERTGGQQLQQLRDAIARADDHMQ